MKNFYDHSHPSADSSRAVVISLRKVLYKYWIPASRTKPVNEQCGWPRWLSWMRVRLVIRRLRVRPPPGRQHSFVKIDHEIFSMAILSLPLIQEGQLSLCPITKSGEGIILYRPKFLVSVRPYVRAHEWAYIG